MKRVLQIFTFQKGYMGGVATIVKSYMNGRNIFADKGYVLDNLNIAPVIHTGLRQIDNLIYIFTQRSYVRKYLKDNMYDVVHIHTSREFLFFKDVLLAKMIRTEFNVPVVVTIHVGSIDTVYNRIGWFKMKSIKLLNRYVAKTIFLSKKMQQDFLTEGLSESKSIVLYNFHDLTPTSKKPIPANCLQLLFVGAIHREKGVLELLQALDSLQEMNFHLNICGKLTDKSIKKEIEYLIKRLGEKVSFCGYVSGEEKTLLYRQSDILILPSYHEGLPVVIMEALSEGCAIISTKVGAIPEVLNDQNCIWVDIASVNSIVQALQSLNRSNIELQKKINLQLGFGYSFSSHVHKLCKLYNCIS